MLNRFLSVFKKKSCYFCQSTSAYLRHYITDRNERVVVCDKCLEYAKKTGF